MLTMTEPDRKNQVKSDPSEANMGPQGLDIRTDQIQSLGNAESAKDAPDHNTSPNISANSNTSGTSKSDCQATESEKNYTY